jgi:hypothetical protein
MPVYKQTARILESGFGWLTDVVVWSDDYESLFQFDTLGVEVNIFQVEGNSEDLDIEAGVFAESELTFKATEASVMLESDMQALNFILAAQDETQLRYCARFLNPSSPPVPDDAVFLGRVRPEMKSRDLEHRGGEYSGDIEPLREWEFSAGSFEVQALLEKDLTDLVLGAVVPGSSPETRAGGIPDSWFQTNGPDRLANFLHLAAHADGFGHRELRFGNLVSLGVLLQELITRAMPAGITATLVDSETDLRAFPARFSTMDSEELELQGGVYGVRSGEKIRYLSLFYNKYLVLSTDSHKLAIRTAAGSNNHGTAYVTWQLVKPPKGQEGAAWLRYKSVGELLYSIAASLGMFVEFSVRLRNRETLVSGSVYPRDYTGAERDVKPRDRATAGKKKWKGDAWHLSREGPGVYYELDVNGGIKNIVGTGGLITQWGKDYGPLPEGEPLALTLSPLVCRLDSDQAEDARTDLSRRGQVEMPHNSVFVDGGTSDTELNRRTEPSKNRVALHTGIYINTLGLAPAVDYSEGVNGASVWAPVAHVTTEANGEPRRFQALADFVNWLTDRDSTAYYEAEYSLTVPYLCSFRATPTGPDDWRNLKLGKLLELDGVEYTVVGIERPYGRAETKLRLHVRSRFIFNEPTTGVAMPPDPDPVIWSENPPPAPYVRRSQQVEQKESAGGVYAFNLVAIRSDGRLEVATAHNRHFRKVYGVALNDGLAAGDMVEVQRFGTVYLTSEWASLGALTPGAYAYLRTPGWYGGDVNRNLGHTPLLAQTVTEDYFFPVGIADRTDSLSLRLGWNGFIYGPPLAP